MQAWPSRVMFPLIFLLSAPPPFQAEGGGGVGFSLTQVLVQVVKMQVEMRPVRLLQVHPRHPGTLVGAPLTQAEPPPYEGRGGVILLVHPVGSPGFFGLPSAGESWEQGLGLLSQLLKARWGLGNRGRPWDFFPGTALLDSFPINIDKILSNV